MNTHESYVSLETAKMLKETGFDWEGTAYYQHGVFYPYSVDRERLVIMNHSSAPAYMEQYSAPTLNVAQRWLREVKNMSVHVFMSPYQSEDPFKWAFSIIYDVEPDRYTSYEEALEAGIQKCLTFLLEKKK